MGDFDRKKYENIMEEVITDPEIRNVILDGFKGRKFNCPDTAYAVASGVVDKLCGCSRVKEFLLMIDMFYFLLRLVI